MSNPQVTVFSIKTCPHCMRAKGMLNDREIDYVEISLTDYPEKRTDMLKVADRLTVPQIFFQNQHIGGASDLADQFENGQADALLKKLQNGKLEKLNPLLEKPDYEPKPQKKATERSEECFSIGDKKLNYVDLIHMLEQELDIKDRKYHLQTYKNCFKGKHLVDVLVSKYGLKTRKEAVQIGKSFAESGILDHVTAQHDFEDADYFYRLSHNQEPTILNSFRVWVDRVDDPEVVVTSCKSKLNDVIKKYRDEADGLVDYELVSKDPDFKDFEESTCELQKIALVSMSDDVKLAFCINLYNMMVLHAFAKVGAPQNGWQRRGFFKGVAYNVGGLKFTMDELENGVIRGNQKPPLALSPPFKKSDPRSGIAFEKVDPRIHFALNCGAKSCPPVKKFSGAAIDEELRVVAMAFAEDDGNVMVDLKKNTLWLTKICAWFAKDFGGDKISIAKTILPWTRGEKNQQLEQLLESGDFKLRHFPYDWSNDAKPSKKDQCSIM